MKGVRLTVLVVEPLVKLCSDLGVKVTELSYY